MSTGSDPEWDQLSDADDERASRSDSDSDQSASAWSNNVYSDGEEDTLLVVKGRSRRSAASRSHALSVNSSPASGPTSSILSFSSAQSEQTSPIDITPDDSRSQTYELPEHFTNKGEDGTVSAPRQPHADAPSSVAQKQLQEQRALAAKTENDSSVCHCFSCHCRDLYPDQACTICSTPHDQLARTHNHVLCLAEQREQTIALKTNYIAETQAQLTETGRATERANAETKRILAELRSRQEQITAKDAELAEEKEKNEQMLKDTKYLQARLDAQIRLNITEANARCNGYQCKEKRVDIKEFVEFKEKRKEVEDRYEEIQEKGRQNVELQGQVAELHKRLEKTHRPQDDKDAQMADLKRKIEGIRQEKILVVQRNYTLQKELDAVKKEIFAEQIKSGVVRSSLAKVSKLRDELAAGREELSAAKKTVGVLKQNIVNIHEDGLSLRSKIDELEAQVQTQKQAKLL